MSSVVVSDYSGSIGFQAACSLLENDCIIVGIDGVTDYRDRWLKQERAVEIRSDSTILVELTGGIPATLIDRGDANFGRWYEEYTDAANIELGS